MKVEHFKLFTELHIFTSIEEKDEDVKTLLDNTCTHCLSLIKAGTVEYESLINPLTKTFKISVYRLMDLPDQAAAIFEIHEEFRKYHFLKQQFLSHLEHLC